VSDADSVAPAGRGPRAAHRKVTQLNRPTGTDGGDQRKPPDDLEDAHVLRGSLNVLDVQGYAVLVVSEIQCAGLEIAEVIRAAGVPFRLYAFPCLRRTAEEIASLLFPRRWSCVNVQH
jgi:hypothetical protein